MSFDHRSCEAVYSRSVSAAMFSGTSAYMVLPQKIEYHGSSRVYR